jgi:hypothetical protein
VKDEDDTAFEEIVKHSLDGQIVTNFMLIAEVVDADGERLSLYMSESMTPWLARGMLASADDLLDEIDESS